MWCDRDSLLHGRVFRYVYANDAVPKFPSRTAGAFAHFGRSFTTTGLSVSGVRGRRDANCLRSSFS